MKTLAKNFWTDPQTCLAALAGVGAAAMAVAGVLDAGGSLSLAVGTGLTALGLGGGTTHAIGGALGGK